MQRMEGEDLRQETNTEKAEAIGQSSIRESKFEPGERANRDILSRAPSKGIVLPTGS